MPTGQKFFLFIDLWCRFVGLLLLSLLDQRLVVQDPLRRFAVAEMKTSGAFDSPRRIYHIMASFEDSPMRHVQSDPAHSSQRIKPPDSFSSHLPTLSYQGPSGPADGMSHRFGRFVPLVRFLSK